MINFFAAVTAVSMLINAPHEYLRGTPDSQAEVVSDTYFSEEITPLEEQGDWMKIRVNADQYEGWINKEACAAPSNIYLNNLDTIAKVNRLSAHLFHVQDTIYGPILTLPFDSKLAVLEPKDPSDQSRWIKVALPDGSEAFIQRGDIVLNPSVISREEMVALSQKFLGLPYTWGGRSSFGYDCSGFVQMLYKQMGIAIPRDSKHQMLWDGFKPVTKEAMIPGDIIIFGLDETRTRHVGMYLGNDKFIHATVSQNQPYIRISNLSESEWNGSGRFQFVTFRTLNNSL